MDVVDTAFPGPSQTTDRSAAQTSSPVSGIAGGAFETNLVSATPRFRTLSSRDAEFTSYLDGSFSDTLVALPVRSLNVDSKSEEVTFEIKPIEQARTVSLARAIFLLIRPSTLIFSMGPMFATFFLLRAHAQAPDLWLALTAFLGVLTFHVATNLLNDFGDHMKGRDRLRPSGGTRVIQNGWLRAHAVKKAAIALTGLAILLGLPSLVASPALIVAGVAFLVTLEFTFQKLRLKRRGWAEILAFLLTGPLLTVGFAWATAAQVSWSTVALGCVFGAMALMYFHSVNFENIMPDSQAGVLTWATRTGFEASKTFFVFTAGLCILTASALAVVETQTGLRSITVFAPALALQAMLLVFACLRVARIKSPVASELVGLRVEAIRLCWVMTLALALTYIWQA